MTAENITRSPEFERVPDNDRKFIVLNGPIDLSVIGNEVAVAYDMTVDYIVIDDDGSGNYSETKVVSKRYDDGTTHLLKISKSKVNGYRHAEKNAVESHDYEQLVSTPIKHLQKRRYECTYTHSDGSKFNLKYDVFESGKLYMIEVGASPSNPQAVFDVAGFPADLREVSDNKDYEGHQIVDTLAKL